MVLFSRMWDVCEDVLEEVDGEAGEDVLDVLDVLCRGQVHKCAAGLVFGCVLGLRCAGRVSLLIWGQD